MSKNNIMKRLFKRIRTAWAVFRGDYEWLAANNLDVMWSMEQELLFKEYPYPIARGRFHASDTIRGGHPFILLYKSPVSGDCYIDYCGTEAELEELKNQEINID